jgi:hypothetical protein
MKINQIYKTLYLSRYMKTTVIFSLILSTFCLTGFVEDVLEVSLFHSGDIELTKEQLKKGIHIRLKISSGKNADVLVVAMSSVKRGNVIDLSLVKAITAKIEDNEVLSLTFDSTKISGPGKYEVALTFKRGTLSDDLNIPLIIPQGKLVLPGQIAISMTQRLFGDELNEPVPILRISESTGLNSVKVIFPDTVFFSGNASRHFGLVFKDKQIEIPAGKPMYLRYRAVGDFPLGEYKNNYQVAVSDEPGFQTIEITVKNIITEYIIIPILLAGIFFGWLLRIFIQEQKNLFENKIKATLLVAYIRKKMHEIDDIGFDVAAKKILETLTIAIDSNKSSAIESAITNSEAEIKKEFDDFNERQKKMEKGLSGVARSPEQQIIDLQTQKRRLLIIETFISALFICLIGFALFASKFDGTFATLVMIFFSGFSLDLTTGSLIEYSKRLPK